MIVATLGYVLSPDRQRVLMIKRDTRSDDEHYGKYNGVGGKLRVDEDVVACVRREVLEEAGITVTALRLAGTVSWPGFGRNDENWFGFIFLIDSFDGDPLEQCDEGSLHWVAKRQILNLPLWEGDRYFLPLVFAEPLRSFHGVLPYKNGRPVSWNVSYLD